MSALEFANLISEKLLEGLQAEAVWLFGSHARGEATPDSDMDFLAVVSHSDESRYRRAVSARRLVRDIHCPKDIIVLTREEWDRELHVPSSLSSTVQKEGVRLEHGSR
jgi:uncharacterized protein